MGNVLNKVRKLNWLLQQTHAGVLSFEEISAILSDMMDANVYTVDIDGSALGMALKVEEDSNIISDTIQNRRIMPEEHNTILLKTDEIRANLHGDEIIEEFQGDVVRPEKYYTIIPILGGGGRCGTLFMTRYEPEFTEEELVIGEFGATIVGLQIQHMEAAKKKEEERKTEAVQMAISTLSYSESEAMQHIFAELEGEDGVLVASKIADRSGITRSVIVNALRKLESAGVIETRSLGMKGTRIRVLNPKLKPELAAIKY